MIRCGLALLLACSCEGGSFVATGGSGASRAMVPRGDSVYWLAEMGLRRASRDGGESVQVSMGTVGDSAVAANATHVFWIDRAFVLRRMPHGGGAEESLGITPTHFAVDDERLVASNDLGTTSIELVGLAQRPLFVGGRTPFELELDGEHVYGATCNLDGSGEVWRIGVANGLVEPISPVCSAMLALDDQHVYTVEPRNNGFAIVRAPKTGRFREAIARVSAQPEISVRDGYVYILSDNTVTRVSSAGGPPELLVQDPLGIAKFATDGTTLYWTLTGSPTTLNRMPLP